MNQMPPVHAYTISGDFDESIKFAIAHFTARNHHLPAAIWLHPSRIPPDWPPAWPPARANARLNHNIIGLEPPAPQRPLQPQLLTIGED